MNFTGDRLSTIFRRTDGDCHICGGKLCFSNYGKFDCRGAWEVEHSNPRCNGGSDRLSNLYPAHISCNRQKGSLTTKTARAWNGRTKAPLSRERKDEIRKDNRWGLGSIGAVLGAGIFGLPGLVLGGILGTIVGDGMKLE